MKKLASFLAVFLMFPIPAFAGWTLSEMRQVDPTESATNGQQCCIRWRLTGTGDGADGDVNITVRRSDNAVFDNSDLAIDNWTSQDLTLSPGGWVEFNTCNKFCQDNQPQGNFHLCVQVEYDGATLSLCSTTKKTCIPSSTMGSTPGDDISSASDGDPISTFTGAFYKHFPTDLDLGGPMPLRFYRYYTSDYVKTTRHASALGTNWRHNFDWSLQKTSASQIQITDNLGRLITFNSANGGATWNLSDPLDIPYQLVNGGANEYILGHPQSNDLYSFYLDPNQFPSKPRGELTAISDAHGNIHSLSYSDRQLITVADGLGRTLSFAYDDSRMLDSVTDDQGRSIAFTHGGSNLRELLTSKDPMMNVTTYSYDGTHVLPGLMTGYLSPEGNTPRTQAYEAGTGRVTTQTSMGNTISLAYAGNLTTVTDPASKTLKHTHSATGELTGVTNENGNTIALAYDGTTKQLSGATDTLGVSNDYAHHAASGRPASITHANGETTGFTYTARAVGNITQYDRTKVTHADGTTDQSVFNASGNLVSHTDRAGYSTTYTYNARGQVLTATNPETGVTTWTYNADGTVATRKDAFNNTTTYGYDAKRRRNLTTYPDTETRIFVYDNNDRLTSSTDRRSNTTSYTYDGNNRVTTLTDRTGNVTTYAYDDMDRLVETEDTSVGGTPSKLSSYDNLERIKEITDQNGNKTSFTYDAQDRLTKITDPLLKQWDFAYDKEGILSGTTDPLSHSNTFTSDVMGRITQGQNPLGKKTKTSYDSMGRVATVTDPLNKVSTWNYDARGQLSSWSLPGAVSASYTRNKLGQITRVTDPRGKFWDKAYTKGRLTSRTDPLARSIVYSYNNMNRVSVMTFPAPLGGTLTFTYDANGNVTRRLYSGAGPDLSYSYDNMDRLLTTEGLTLQRDILGRIIKSNDIDISYDSAGRLTSVDLDVAGSTKTITYTYDANDRLKTVSDWVGGSTTFAYDNAGRLLTITRPNGVTSTYGYDNDDKVASITEKKGAATISSHNLVRDAAGQVSTAMRNVITGPTFNDNTVNRSFDAAGQISGFTYDALGRLTNTNTGTTRTWDLASRMTSSNNGTVTNYTYDGLGQRLSKAVSGGDTRSYVWNQALAFPSISIEKNNGANLRYYVHTPGGRLLHSVDAGGGTRHFYHYDETGNTQFVSNDSGAAEVSYHHDPYGRLLGQSGVLDNPFTWQGMLGVMDDGDGQFYARARYYDAASQRFISKDPVIAIDPARIDPYQYAAGNPLMYGDPSGLKPGDSATDTALEGANRGASAAQVVVAIVDLASNATPAKAIGGAIAFAGVFLGFIDDDTAELAGDATVILGVAEVTVTASVAASAAGVPLGSAAAGTTAASAGAGSVAAAGAVPITALVVTSIWSATQVIKAGIEGVLLGGDLIDLYDAYELEDKQAAFLEERKAAAAVLKNASAAAAEVSANASADSTVASSSSHRETPGKVLQIAIAETTRERYDREKQAWKDAQPSEAERLEEFNRAFRGY